MAARITPRYEEGIVILELQGRITLGESGRGGLVDIVARTLHEGSRFFILELSELSYLDSTGLAEFIKVFTDIRKVGGDVILTSPSQRVRDVFSITHFSSIFTIVESTDEAKTLLKKQMNKAT